MYRYLVAGVVAIGAALSSVAAFATDTPLVVPTLGVDWAGSVTAFTTAITTIVLACLGLWAGLKLVCVAKRFIGGAVMGR